MKYAGSVCSLTHIKCSLYTILNVKNYFDNESLVTMIVFIVIVTLLIFYS